MQDHTTPLRSEVHERRLANGLAVLVVEDRRAPVVAVVTHVAAGYFDEPEEVAGISHVLEHMFFKGTARRGPGDIGRETQTLGGYLNAGTIYDRTTYYTVLPSSAWERALDIQSDALRHSVIDPDELARELRVIIEEGKRKLDTPSAVARETLFETMFDAHRMRRWRIGLERVLSGLTRQDVLRFYHELYRAGNIVLCVAGDIVADAVFERVEQLYGSMSAALPERDVGPAEPPRRGFRFREIRGDIRQSLIEWGWRTPGALHADTPILDLFSVVLGQGRASRLYRDVREAGLVTEIGAFSYTPRDIGVFGIHAIAQPADVPQALDAIHAVVERSRDTEPAADEVERARNILEAGLLRRFETVEGQATLLAEWQALGDWRLFEAYRDRLLSAQPRDLARVASGYLDPADATVLVYRPAAVAGVTWQPSTGEIVRAARKGQEPERSARLSANGRAAPVGIEDGIHFFRADGVDVVVLPRREVPLVSIAFGTVGGVVEEAREAAGLTSLMARTSVKATATRGAARLADEVESIGASLVQAVGSDTCDWSLTLPSRHLDAGIELLADVVRQPSFPAAELDLERRAVLSDAESLRDDMVRYPLRLFLEAAFPGDAYGHTLEDVESTARAAAREDLVEWHRRTVLQRAATLFVVGDVDPARAAQLGTLFATAGAGPDPARAAGWPESARRRIVERATAQTAFVAGFPGPARNELDADALRVLSATVSGLGGRLFEELRSRRSLAYTVTTQLMARRRGGAFIGYIATSPEREDEARSALFEEFGRLASERLPEADVDRARRYLIGSRQVRLQRNGARLAELAGALQLGTGLEELRTFEARIGEVTPAAIRDAAGRWFDTSRTVEAVVRGSGQSR